MKNPNGPYPGRQLFLGMTASGKPAFVYLVTGRSPQSRERKASQIIDWVRDQCKPFIKDFDKIEFKMISTGPPVGKAINVVIKGDDFSILNVTSSSVDFRLKSE